MKFIIKVKDTKFSAKNKEEAEDIALDIVNDIGHDGAYEIVKQGTTKPKTKKCPLCKKLIKIEKDYLAQIILRNTPLVQGGSPPPKEGHTIFYHFDCFYKLF